MNSDALLNIPGQKLDTRRLFKRDLSVYLMQNAVSAPQNKYDHYTCDVSNVQCNWLWHVKVSFFCDLFYITHCMF